MQMGCCCCCCRRKREAMDRVSVSALEAPAGKDGPMFHTQSPATLRPVLLQISRRLPLFTFFLFAATAVRSFVPSFLLSFFIGFTLLLPSESCCSLFLLSIYSFSPSGARGTLRTDHFPRGSAEKFSFVLAPRESFPASFPVNNQATPGCSCT